MAEVKHIAIILDGNRRWAKARGLLPWQGHQKGAEKLKKMLEWCNELGITEFTAYAFSMQNFNRKPEEVNHLMRIFKNEFKQLLTEENTKKAKEEGVRVKFLGRIEMFPEDLQKVMREIMEKTKTNRPKTVNFCMGYGGREEITDAAKKLALAIKEGRVNIDDIDEQKFSEHLYMNSEPDLVIRTGGKGAQRTSNFLPWQSNYSEWFFLDKMLPELEKEDLIKIIEEFKTRERRYGK